MYYLIILLHQTLDSEPYHLLERNLKYMSFFSIKKKKMLFSKKTLFNTTKVVILVFLIFNFISTPIEAARPRPRPLHDMKPTLVANKARFLQNQETLPISSPNPCTYIPTPSKEHCH